MKAYVLVYITDSARKVSRGYASPPYQGMVWYGMVEGNRVYKDPRTMHDHGGHKANTAAVTATPPPMAGYIDPGSRIAYSRDPEDSATNSAPPAAQYFTATTIRIGKNID